MSTEQNKETTRRLVEEVLNTGDLNRVTEFFAPDYVEHSAPPGVPANVEGVRIFFGMLHKAFPDIKYSIEDSIIEGDMVMQRLMGHGTMTGEMLGMTPSGKQATWQEIHTARIRDGRIVEHWGTVDQLGMLQQLGFGPPAA